MPRPTQTWLLGLGATGLAPTDSPQRGARLGLPADGPGSVASTGSRGAGFVVDMVVCGLIGGLGVFFDAGPRARNLIGVVAIVLLYACLLPTTGQTYGMRLTGIRVQRLSGGPITFVRAFVRGLLVVLLLPALFTDRDGRGLHDRAAGSVVVRA